MAKNTVRMVPFVLDDHTAKRAGPHYDLRLKYPDRKKLISFALGKHYIPKKVGERVLAAQTPDHEMEWLTWQGEIPEGEYGAGKVKIAQKGTAEIINWREGHISFKVEGDLMNGKYALIKLKPTEKYPHANYWILIKARDVIDEEKEPINQRKRTGEAERVTK